jgi:hypothetical protein
MHFITGRSAWHSTKFCFDFNNTVQHVHTLNSLDTDFGLGQNSGNLGSTKPRTVSFVWPKPKRNRLDWLIRADIAQIMIDHSQANQRHVHVDAAASRALYSRL